MAYLAQSLPCLLCLMHRLGSLHHRTALKRLPLSRHCWVAKTPLACGARWAPSSLDAKNSRPQIALAMESTRTLAMCGPVKNQQSSLFGPYLCPSLANGSSQSIPPKTSPTGSFSVSHRMAQLRAFLQCPVQHAWPSSGNRRPRPYRLASFL